MSSHLEKSIAVADKINRKALDALAALAWEMTAQKWPGEFRAIVWDAVADMAARRADEARRS